MAIIGVLALIVVILVVMNMTRKPEIDYFATATEPSQTMGMLLTRALAAVGYNGPDIELKSSLYVPSAAAMIHDGKNYILYNPRTMALADRAGFKTIGQVAILAREIGHLQNCRQFIGSPGEAVQHDIQAVDPSADDYCGYLLARYTPNINDCVNAQRLLLMLSGTPDEGDIRKRIEAVTNGWQRGGGENPDQLKSQLEARLIPELQGIGSWW